MIKKELLKMPKLRATPYMLRRAKADKPKDVRVNKYTNWSYLRCCTKKGVLKVSFFMTEAMRYGGTKPIYDIYFDRKNKKYITYSHEKEKWLTASLRNLYWPDGWFNRHAVYVPRESNKILKKYFKTDKSGANILVCYQDDVMAENLEKRHRKVTDPWDEDLKQTPKQLPKDFEKWLDKEATDEHFVFYNYSRKKYTEGYCTYCENTVSIEKPHYNSKGICPVCHKEITFKSLGRFGYFVTQEHPSYILQRCKDGLMIREFHSHRVYHRGLPFAPQFDYYEIRRIVCNDAGMPLRAYFYGDFKRRAFRWIGGRLCGSQYYADNGRIYEKTLRKLSEKELKCTALNEWYEYKGKIDPEVFLMHVKETPYIEKLIKAGFTELAEELLNGKSFNILYRINPGGSSLKKILCIDSVRLKELKETNGGFEYLSWLQYEKGQNVFLSRYLKKWFIGHNLMPNDLSFISDRMSAVQILNYINKQMNALNMTCNEVMDLWKDYLAMAVKLNMDTNDAIIYRAGKLRQRHAELVNLLQRKDLHERANEIIKSYPLLPDVFSYVKAKYEYAGETFSVIAPSCVEDVLAEGRNLHHCVAEQDRYLDRIERRESYILFLRRTNEPDVSYYTLEVEPGGTIRQKRTLYDRNDEDIITAEPFLREWQKVIKKRLSEEDKSLAETSKVLRLEEFAELDENNILIHGGELRGIRLVDVLMKDLLEAA